MEQAHRAVPHHRQRALRRHRRLASYLITGPQGHVLVDTGLVEANPQIKANIAKLGFKLSDVKILINTHATLIIRAASPS